LLATSLEQQFRDDLIDTEEIAQLFKKSYQRRIRAQIYSLYKDSIDLEMYITNRQGIVVYDSTGRNIGEDYSDWRDVKLTLAGYYGARTSYRYPDKTAQGDEKVMVVAAPILVSGDIVGVLSVVKPVRPLEQLLAIERLHLTLYVLAALAIAMVVGYLLSHGFTRSIRKLVHYANSMATGKRSKQPTFMDKRFDNLATAITHLRDELDGKEYVEHYIHGLTHELKTPLTSVSAAAELLSEDMPAADQKQFIDNIRASNQRMQSLVERILDLAKLENLNALNEIKTFDLSQLIRQQLQQSQALMTANACSVDFDHMNQAIMVEGDDLLLRQCIGNLLDNAIENSPPSSVIRISYQQVDAQHQLSIINPGHLDDYVLERAFERFFSAQSQEGVRKRTGLGLSFAKEIMQLHQGSITLSNTDNGVSAQMQWPTALQTR